MLGVGEEPKNEKGKEMLNESISDYNTSLNLFVPSTTSSYYPM